MNNNNKISQMFIAKAGLDGTIVLKRPIRGKSGFSLENLVLALVSTSNIIEAATQLGYSDNPVKQSIREYLLPIFPSRKSDFFGGGGKSRWKYAILEFIGYKECPKCENILPIVEYTKNISNSNGLASWCRHCCLQHSKQHKHYIAERTPLWSDLDNISVFYKNCPKGYEVDHIIPLRGDLVSGLHVLDNLQYLTKSANREKSNKY